MHTEENIRSPLVSVIMPAYNAASYLREAISSVISQSVTDWELFVIDDGSSDNSRDIAAEFAQSDPRIQLVVNEKNMGVAKTRNRGIEMSKGQYIAFLDSDDVWHPEKLEHQLDRIAGMNADICYCSYAIIGADGNKVRADYLVPDEARFEDILKENFIQCSAMLIRSDIVKGIMFNTAFYHEDYILGLDMLREGNKAVGCTDILLDWRYIENSRSFDKKKSARNRWRIYRDYLKLPLYRAIYLFMCYTVAGLKKYMRKYR